MWLYTNKPCIVNLAIIIRIKWFGWEIEKGKWVVVVRFIFNVRQLNNLKSGLRITKRAWILITIFALFRKCMGLWEFPRLKES